ncbi:MAG: hypothetical protein ABIH66_06300 [bacterium]
MPVGFEIIFFFAGMAMIVFMMLRHTRGRIKGTESHARRLDHVRLKKLEKDSEFGGDVKWSIEDDD